MTWNHIIDNDPGDSPMSPYYDDKDEELEEDWEKECPICFGIGAFYDGDEDNLLDCQTCKGSGVVSSDYETPEEDLLDWEEE